MRATLAALLALVVAVSPSTARADDAPDTVAVYLGARGEMEWMFPFAIFGATGLLGIRFSPLP